MLSRHLKMTYGSGKPDIFKENTKDKFYIKLTKCNKSCKRRKINVKLIKR